MGTIIEYAASLADAIICIWFITKFINTRKNIIAALLATIVYFGVILFCDEYLPNFNVLGVIILFVISLMYAFYICKKHYIKAILACAIYKSVIILSSSTIFTVISSIVKDFELLLQGANSTVRLVYISIHKIILVSILTLMLVLFKNESITDIVTGIVTFAVSVLTILGLGANLMIFQDIRINQMYLRLNSMREQTVQYYIN